MGMAVGTAVLCGRTVGLLMKHSVKLGEAGKATGHCNVGYGMVCAGQKKLSVDDPHILYVFCQPETGGLFKLPG